MAEPPLVTEAESFTDIIEAINNLEGNSLQVAYPVLHELCKGRDTALGLLRTCIELSERQDMRILERVGCLEVWFL